LATFHTMSPKGDTFDESSCYDHSRDYRTAIII
jgi:hypothetical protein